MYGVIDMGPKGAMSWPNKVYVYNNQFDRNRQTTALRNDGRDVCDLEPDDFTYPEGVGYIVGVPA